MELTIKEIAPYIPYGLNTEYRLGDVINSPLADETRSKLLTPENVDFVLKYCKPLLRPLSDLTKEDIQNEILIRWGGGLSDKAKENWLKQITDEMMYSAYNSLRYDFVELMLEKHLDVFGLIPNNLAIDLNTIQQ